MSSGAGRSGKQEPRKRAENSAPEPSGGATSPSSADRGQGSGSDSSGKRPNSLTNRFPAENLTVLAHFYRGEMARSNVWRQKMDVTTNWAIVTTTAAISVAYSSPEPELHLIFPFASLVVFLLLNIEARRYRFFDVWRTRVRMLECHLMVPALLPELPLIEGNWRNDLGEDLLLPTYKISYLESIGRRLHRNYVWIFGILFVAWVGKALLQGENQVFEWKTLYDAFGWGVVPPWLVISSMAFFYSMILIVYLGTSMSRQATGEIRRREKDRKKWPI